MQRLLLKKIRVFPYRVMLRCSAPFVNHHNCFYKYYATLSLFLFGSGVYCDLLWCSGSFVGDPESFLQMLRDAVALSSRVQGTKNKQKKDRRKPRTKCR